MSAEQTVYILHSQACVDYRDDLRTCPYSVALDNGIAPSEWIEDAPCFVRVKGVREEARLVPDGI